MITVTSFITTWFVDCLQAQALVRQNLTRLQGGSLKCTRLSQKAARLSKDTALLSKNSARVSKKTAMFIMYSGMFGVFKAPPPLLKAGQLRRKEAPP